MGRKLPLLPYVRRLTSKNLVTCPSALSKMLLKGNEDDFLPSPLFPLYPILWPWRTGVEAVVVYKSSGAQFVLL